MRRWLLLVPALLAGCATPSDKVPAVYVPQSTYAAASCDDIARDMQGIRRQLIATGVLQDQASSRDREAVFATLFLAWPAIFLVKGNENKQTLARAKGEFDALTAAGVAKGCITESQAGDAKWSYVPPPLPRVDRKGNPVP